MFDYIIYLVSGRELQVTKCQCKVWVGGLRVAKTANPPQCGRHQNRIHQLVWLKGIFTGKRGVIFFGHWWQGFLYVFDQIKHASPGLTAGRSQLVAWRSAIFMEPVAVQVWNSMPRPQKSRYFLWFGMNTYIIIHPRRPNYLLCLTLELQLQHRDVGGESRYNRNTFILVHTHFTYIILYSHSYKSELIPTSWEPHHKSETGTTYHTPFPLILTPLKDHGLGGLHRSRTVSRVLHNVLWHLHPEWDGRPMDSQGKIWRFGASKASCAAWITMYSQVILPLMQYWWFGMLLICSNLFKAW